MSFQHNGKSSVETMSQRTTNIFKSVEKLTATGYSYTKRMNNFLVRNMRCISILSFIHWAAETNAKRQITYSAIAYDFHYHCEQPYSLRYDVVFSPQRSIFTLCTEQSFLWYTLINSQLLLLNWLPATAIEFAMVTSIRNRSIIQCSVFMGFYEGNVNFATSHFCRLFAKQMNTIANQRL